MDPTQKRALIQEALRLLARANLLLDRMSTKHKKRLLLELTKRQMEGKRPVTATIKE